MKLYSRKGYFKFIVRQCGLRYRNEVNYCKRDYIGELKKIIPSVCDIDLIEGTNWNSWRIVRVWFKYSDDLKTCIEYEVIL